MRIIEALPMPRYAAAAAHAKTPAFIQLRDKTIAMLRQWVKDSRVNRQIRPALWFSYGKDGMAVFLLLKMAGIEFVSLVLDNGSDIPGHQLVWPEFDVYAGLGGADKIIYRTKYRQVDTLRMGLEWGRAYGFKKSNGTPIDFWDWGKMTEPIHYSILGQFQFLYGEKAPFVLRFWGNRAGEGMGRAFEIQNYGLLQEWDNKEGFVPTLRGLPIGRWKELDIWALLVSQNCPVSPVYSMNKLPQKNSKGSMPRTLAYCAPEIFSSAFYRWLAHYAPAQLKELCKYFPEIPARFRKSPETSKRK